MFPAGAGRLMYRGFPPVVGAVSRVSACLTVLCRRPRTENLRGDITGAGGIGLENLVDLEPEAVVVVAAVAVGQSVDFSREVELRVPVVLL